MHLAMVDKAVCIHIEQLQFLTIFWYHVVIVKFIHDQHAQIQYSLFDLGLTHLHPWQVLAEFSTILEARLHYQLKVLSFICTTLMSLCKNAVVHELEKVIFKLVGFLCSQSCIQINISFEPCILLKLGYSVHFLKHQPLFQWAQMCTTYFFLILRFNTSLCTMLIFIFSTMKETSLCILCSSSG